MCLNSTNLGKFCKPFNITKLGGGESPRHTPYKAQSFFHAYISIWNNSQILENHKVETFRNTKCLWVHSTRIWKPKLCVYIYIHHLKGFFKTSKAHCQLQNLNIQHFESWIGKKRKKQSSKCEALNCYKNHHVKLLESSNIQMKFVGLYKIVMGVTYPQLIFFVIVISFPEPSSPSCIGCCHHF